MHNETHTLESHIQNLREKGFIGQGRTDPFEKRLRSDHRIMEEKAHREKKPISFSVPVTLTVADGVDPMKIRFHFSYDPFTNKTRNSGVNVVLGQFRHLLFTPNPSDLYHANQLYRIVLNRRRQAHRPAAFKQKQNFSAKFKHP